MSNSDRSALGVFRQYGIGPGQMLCFHGSHLEKHGDALRRLTSLGLVTKERFAGGYSLTSAGFAVMHEQQPRRKS
jgi:hypothetical protein